MLYVLGRVEKSRDTLTVCVYFEKRNRPHITSVTTNSDWILQKVTLMRVTTNSNLGH